MPLEQIRPSVQFFRSDRHTTSDEAAQQYELATDEIAEMHEAYDEYTESPRLENMNLLKLGGVGGVTRSGSWNRNLSSREQLKSSVRSSEMHEEDSEPVDSSNTASTSRQSIQSSGSLHRSKSGSHPEKIRRNIVEQIRPSSSSDVPSSSSRTSTSTSSYSAAAFSLRSLSNRNSISSTSSSGASSARSPTAASGDESTATNSSSSKGKSQDIYPSSSSTYTGTNNASVLGVQLHPHQTFEMKAREQEQTYAGLDCLQSGRNSKAPKDPGLPDGRDALHEDRQGVRSCDWPNASPIKSDLARSPRNDSLPLPTKLVSPSLGTLTLSAAAASPASPVMTTYTTSTSTFVPPAPRRHTSTFALKSRSAFAQSGQPHGNFTGAGGGRAAAREIARRGESNSYDNAPFSELEARRLRNPSSNPSSHSASPNPPHQCLPLTPPSSDFQFIAATPHSANENGKRHSNQFSPRNTDAVPFSDGILGSPRLVRRRELSNSSEFSSIRGETSYQSSRKSSIRPSDVDTAKANASCSPQLLHTPSGNTSVVSPTSAASILNRPSLSHAHTTTNVLRTPTTEEWSRFLAKQGVDPAAVAAASVGVRPRTNTGRSSTSQQTRRLLSTLGSSPSLTTDSAFATVSQQQEDGQNVYALDMAHVEEEEEEEREADEQELVSSLGRLGLHRIPIPGKGILPPSDDLSMLHEDYEGEQDSEADEGSSSDERMRALHEAISRPPSRRGSPPILDSPDSPTSILESEWDKMIKSPILAATARKRGKRPSRQTAAIVLGYPLAPPGERRKIDDFIIQTDIGRGAYGLVKRARLKDPITDLATGREFVIKYIIKSRILADCWRRHKILGPIPIEIHVMDQLRRLPYKAPINLPPWSVESLLEYPDLAQDRALSRLKESVGHPSLCKMVDFFEDHEFYYMVMPCFGKGQDLFDYVEAQPHGLSSMQVRCIFGQVADGLCFLHQNNIVHRDIKDENVILDGDGHAQIIDFGSAAHVNKSGRLFDTFSGTLDYAAAEILKGEKYGGKEQDVWALGVVGYVLLCGDCPFWNGEEAIQGVVSGTRAYDVLLERCCTTVIGSEEYEKRLTDRMGQKDGGGKIEDAADLIQRCLEINVAMRPSMEIICQHRFLIGAAGWIGSMGWLKGNDAVSP